MISFVCWKWRGARGFRSEHVNVLAAMVERHYPDPHRFICVTDDPDGLKPWIEYVPIPLTGFEDLANPSQKTAAKPFPSCYRRLWNFSRDARAVLGERIFALDVDVIVVADLRPLVAKSASFVGWCDPRFMWNKCAGGAYLLTTGAHCDVFDDFDPEASPAAALAAGYGGSDQGWMSAKLHPPAESFGTADGVIKLRWLRPRAALQKGPRLIFTNGDAPPWAPQVQKTYPWIRQHWRM